MKVRFAERQEPLTQNVFIQISSASIHPQGLVMHVVFYILAAPFGLIGALEAINGVFQWGAWVLLNIFHLFFGQYQSMADIVKDFPGGPAFFYRYHGMIAAFASPVFLAIGGALMWIGASIKAAEKKAQWEIQSEQARQVRSRMQAVANEAQLRAERELKRSRIVTLLDCSASLAQEIPKHAQRATSATALAEQEFADGLLDPFWDAVEAAVIELAHIDSSTRSIAANLDAVGKESLSTDSQRAWATVIASGLREIPASAAVHARLQVIIRRAQKSVAFTTIYHLRKTNKILVNGFSTLGHALSAMTERLESAIDEVGNSLFELKSSNASLSEAIVKEITGFRQQTAASNATRSDSELRILDTLDNIQRGRRPAGPEWKQGTVRR